MRNRRSDYDACPLCGGTKRTKNKKCAQCWARKPGDTFTHSAGYVLEYAPEHPRAHNGYVYQHVLVWERATGLTLPTGYTVHHRNGVKDDNRPDNLEPLTRGGHSARHMTLERARAMQAKTVAARHSNGSYLRPTHCIHGHEFTSENTYVRADGRHCKACQQRRSLEYKARKRAAA